MSEFDYGAANRRIAEKLGEVHKRIAESEMCMVCTSSSCRGCENANIPDYAHDPAATLRLMEWLITTEHCIEIDFTRTKGIAVDVSWQEAPNELPVMARGNGTTIGEALVQAYDEVLEEEGK